MLSLSRTFDEGGRPAVIAFLMTFGTSRNAAQKLANALQRARREGAPLVRHGELPPSKDVVPLPEGWHARVFCLSDIHVDHETNRKWLQAATARLSRVPKAVDVLVCCGDLCEDIDDLREVTDLPLGAPRDLPCHAALRSGRLPRRDRDLAPTSTNHRRDLAVCSQVLSELRLRFDHVVFTPGNHDLWVSACSLRPRPSLTLWTPNPSRSPSFRDLPPRKPPRPGAISAIAADCG